MRSNLWNVMRVVTWKILLFYPYQNGARCSRLDDSRAKRLRAAQGGETERPETDMEGGLSFLCNISGAPSPLLSSSSNKSLSLNAPSKRRRIISEIQEIRVCTNRTCCRQGSLQTLETLSGLAPPNVAVKSCGCLGHCGAGPNLVALPGNGVVVGHCGTPARAAQVMVGLLLRGHDSDNTAAKTALEMLALKKRAQRELDDGNFSQAELLLSQENSFAFNFTQYLLTRMQNFD